MPQHTPSDRWFTVEAIDADTYAISEYAHWEEPHCYLLNGDRASLLIDTGLGVGQIAAVAAGQELLHRKAGVFFHKASRRTCCDQPVLRQDMPIGGAKLYHQLLFGVVSHQGDYHNATPSFSSVTR